MDNNDTCLIGEPDALGIFKTIYLFLQNHNFTKSAETFREEWGLDKEVITKVSNKPILLSRCRCSKSQANQTEAKTGRHQQHHWLEGSFQTETLQLKPDDTHVFYVCDHCQQKRNHRADSINEDQTTHEEDSPRSEARKLKSKFSQLHSEHQKLIAVTGELTTALQMNIIGQTKNINAVLEQCKAIYPALFDNCASLEEEGREPNENSNVQMEPQAGTGEYNEFARAFQTSEPAPNEISPLTLERASPRSPRLSPLTPETVRYVLETVIERIFEMENTTGDCTKPAQMKREEVEKIVGDVFDEAMGSPSDGRAGDGDFSRPTSKSVARCKHQFFFVDYAKLKSDLIHSDNEKKTRILQALRWRITKNDAIIREKVVASYVSNDLLDLQANISIPEKLLLGYGIDHYAQESICRLINTLASLRQGRDYLTSDERLLRRVLIKKVKDVRTVSGAIIRNMLVASVQKLSIRKQCRVRMVNEGLFEVIVNYLDDFYEKLSKYCLEYCSALLMNLCLVDEAKNKSSKNPKKIVGLLRKFLESENECCLPYINGVMFSLFEKSEIVEEAVNQNLDKTIASLIETTNNTNVKKQLDFILQSRLFGKSDPYIRDEEEDNKEEVDLLEAELDQDDFITQLPSGEHLLEEYKRETTNPSEEKTANTVSFFALKKDSPNSAKSFSEETKQFHHKPSGDKGIFEIIKPARHSACSRGLIKNFVRKKSINTGRYPATPLCYMESCQRIQYGSGAQCSCSKCVPGQNRYSCGCYDAICKDITEGETGCYNRNLDLKSRW